MQQRKARRSSAPSGPYALEMPRQRGQVAGAAKMAGGLSGVRAHFPHPQGGTAHQPTKPFPLTVGLCRFSHRGRLPPRPHASTAAAAAAGRRDAQCWHHVVSIQVPKIRLHGRYRHQRYAWQSSIANQHKRRNSTFPDSLHARPNGNPACATPKLMRRTLDFWSCCDFSLAIRGKCEKKGDAGGKIGPWGRVAASIRPPSLLQALTPPGNHQPTSEPGCKYE